MTDAGVAAPTLDTLFRRTAARQPDAPALIDPADKARVTQTAPRRLSYAQADAAVTAIARHFRQAGLPEGSIVALQLPNTVEFVLTLLGVWRAGLIAAPLPLLWRHADLVAALTRVSARALVVQDRVDGVDLAATALGVAAEVFPIRHVCGFGPALPEEIVPIETGADAASSPATPEPQPEALVTFDVTHEGLLAVHRTHAQVIAGGLAIHLEAGPAPSSRILSTMPPSSFAGLSATMTCWLLGGGTLSLHHAFDAEALNAQMRDDRCDTVVMPAPLALRLAEAEWPAKGSALRRVLGLWRSPEQAGASPDWMLTGVALTDIHCFGEAGLIAARRSAGGIQPLGIGPRRAPHTRADAPLVAETLITPAGTLALRGPMVPSEAPPVGTPSPAASASDWVDTRYAARRERTRDAFSITAPPAGVMSVGGYRFRAADLQDIQHLLGDDVTLAALPDRLNGSRLAGRAGNDAATRHAALERGLNALVGDAFRTRGDVPRDSGGRD